MNAVKKHAVLTAVAMAVGIGVVFWLRPTTSGGTIFIVVVCVILVNGVGAIWGNRS
jgi:hypothetical protein